MNVRDDPEEQIMAFNIFLEKITANQGITSQASKKIAGYSLYDRQIKTDLLQESVIYWIVKWETEQTRKKSMWWLPLNLQVYSVKVLWCVNVISSCCQVFLKWSKGFPAYLLWKGWSCWVPWSLCVIKRSIQKNQHMPLHFTTVHQKHGLRNIEETAQGALLVSEGPHYAKIVDWVFWPLQAYSAVPLDSNRPHWVLPLIAEWRA